MRRSAGTAVFEIGGKTRRKLEELGRREGLTLFMVLLGGLQVVLGRWAGQEDVAVGTPIANRNRLEVEGVIGFFVNTLVLRTRWGGEEKVKEVLRRIRGIVVEGYEHQDVPFEKLVEELAPERELNRTPLFQVMMTLQNAPREQLQMQGLQVERFALGNPLAKFDLGIAISETSDGLTGGVEYFAELFLPGTVDRLMSHFKTVLEQMVLNPNASVDALSLMNDEEQHQVLVEWNQTECWYPSECLHTLFEKRVKESPEAIAIEFSDQQISYSALNKRANQLGHYLKGLGVKAETCVGLAVERSPEMIIGLLGILKAGGAYVPMEPGHPVKRLRYICEDSGIEVLLTLKQAQELVGKQVCLDNDWQKIEQELDEDPASGANADNLAYVIYTSGSTGKPKGVLVRHAGLSNVAEVSMRRFAALGESRVLQLASLTFDASVLEITLGLLSGGRLCISPSGGMIDGEDFKHLLQEREITTMALPPSLLNMVPGGEFPLLGTIIVGGESSSVEIAQKWSRDRRFFNAYAPTEATIYATVWEYEGREEKRVPVGRAIGNMQVYLLDAQMQPLPVGAKGELYLGGVGLARGYANSPDLTAERFVPNPFSKEPGTRLYRTGDVGRYRADGNLEFIGRTDHQVKIRGYRIELGEIESALLGHKDVEQAVVSVRTEESGQKRLVGYVVGKAGVKLESGELRRYVQQQLPEYMVPGVFVQLEEMPLTSNGKLDRKALPEPEWGGGEQGSYVGPRNRREEILAGVWAQVLRVARVGVHDNFFELGGDSILSLQIVARARQAGLEIAVRDIFQYQTVAALAEVVGEGAGVIEAEQGEVVGAVPLTPIQRYFLEQEQPGVWHFNQAVFLDAPEGLDAVLLEEVFEELVRHHDALRMRFEYQLGEGGTGEWKQNNEGWQEGKSGFVCVDLEEVQGGQDRKEVIERIAAGVQGSLDLEGGRLMRSVYMRLGEEEGRLLLVAHHLVVDGVSWRIMLEDVQRMYEQLQAGKRVELPAKGSSFRRWAEGLQEYARSEEVEEEREYWERVEGGESGRLPRDYEGGKNTVESERSVGVELGEEETEILLQELPRKLGGEGRIQEGLLAALVEALGEWSGEWKWRVEMEGHGREGVMEGVDVSRTVGWFTSMYPVELESEAGKGRLERVREIGKRMRSIPGQGLGYGLLKYGEKGEKWEKRSRAEEREISFNYLGQFDQVLNRGVGAGEEKGRDGRRGAEGEGGEGRRGSVLGVAPESAGRLRHAGGYRTHVLEITGSVRGHRLQMAFTYSANFHRAATIQSFAERFRSSLHALAAEIRRLEVANTSSDDWTSLLTQVQRQRALL